MIIDHHQLTLKTMLLFLQLPLRMMALPPKSPNLANILRRQVELTFQQGMATPRLTSSNDLFMQSKRAMSSSSFSFPKSSYVLGALKKDHTWSSFSTAKFCRPCWTRKTYFWITSLLSLAKGGFSKATFMNSRWLPALRCSSALAFFSSNKASNSCSTSSCDFLLLIKRYQLIYIIHITFMYVIISLLPLAYALNEIAIHSKQLQNQLYIVTDSGKIYDYDALTRQLNWVADLSQSMVKHRSNSSYPIYPADNGMFWLVDQHTQMVRNHYAIMKKITLSELDEVIRSNCLSPTLLTHTSQQFYTIDLQNGELFKIVEFEQLFENIYDNLVVIKLERKYITDTDHQHCDQYNTKIEINFLKHFLQGNSIPRRKSTEFKIHKKADNQLSFSSKNQPDYIIETQDAIIDIIGFDLEVGFYNHFYTQEDGNALMLPGVTEMKCYKEKKNQMVPYSYGGGEEQQDFIGTRLAYVDQLIFLLGLILIWNLLRCLPREEEKKEKEKEREQEQQQEKPQIPQAVPPPKQKPLFTFDKSRTLGSGKTNVYEGSFQGRPIAVRRISKRKLSNNYCREIEALQQLEHKYIVRMYCYQEGNKSVYIGMERCAISLSEFVRREQEKSKRLAPLKEVVPIPKEWIPATLPTQKVLKHVLKALVYLDRNNMAHQNIKPDNIFLSREGETKLADVGFSKFCKFCPNAWHPKEMNKSDIKADVFSLGCVAYFLATRGGHPFNLDESRMASRKPVDVFRSVKDVLLADMIESMIKKAKHPREYLAHPFFWNPQRKLKLILDASNQFELQSKEEQKQLEEKLKRAFKAPWNWQIDAQIVNMNIKLPLSQIDDLNLRRSYEFYSGRHLVRFIRNCHSHYYDLSEKSRQLLRANDYCYWEERFPHLLLRVHQLV